VFHKKGSASNQVLTLEAVEQLSFCHEEATEADVLKGF
jgi:hypothetical protein